MADTENGRCMLTDETADYTKEMDRHYCDSWSVHRWSLCVSWFVLMCQLIIIDFRMLATIFCVISARAVSQAWTGNRRTDSAATALFATLATRMFPLPWMITACFSASWQIALLSMTKYFAPTVHVTDLVWIISSQHFYLKRPYSIASLQYSSMPHNASLQINAEGYKSIQNQNWSLFA